MADSNDSPRPPLGAFELRESASASRHGPRAAVLSLLWLAFAGGVLFFTDGEGSRALLGLVALVVPVGLIWVASYCAEASRVMHAESLRIQGAVETIRQSYVAQAQGQTGKTDAPSQTLMRRLDEIAAAQRAMQGALAGLGAPGGSEEAAPRAETAPKPAARPATARPQGKAAEAARSQTAAPQGMPRKAAARDEQASLALGTPQGGDVSQISNADLIRALNFPETAEDREGFAALRRALKERPSAQLIQAAQDVLTLLSQEGIYMDDLRPDMARPEIWRHFATGERGRIIAPLGGIHDEDTLQNVAIRMKQDPIFRDAAHHFLRLFDKSFARFEPTASDSEIAAYADTRTARAFMLLGRVAGTFD